MIDPNESCSEQILVLAPTGRDAQVVVQVLAAARIEAVPCEDVAELLSRGERCPGALLVAEEALTAPALAALAASLAAQPSWSDLPTIVSTARGEGSDAVERVVSALAPSANVTVIERPFRKATLVTVVQACLRARRRQYELRRLLRQMERQTHELITEREARERFVSMLAHDLRGPLTIARLVMHQLLVAPERRLDLKVKVDRNLDRIEHMIRDMLDVNLINAGGRLPLRVDQCDLAAIATEVVDEIGNVEGRDRIRLEGEERLLGWWSAEEIRRSLWNLVSNAVKYGAPDQPVVVALEQHGNRVVLSVHNEGAPIPPDEQERLFEPYRRTRESEKTKQLGWGLGLTLVRGCAEAHGGSVRVTSDAQHGTTFFLSLPLDARPFQPVAPPAGDEKRAGADSERPQVH